MTSGTITYIVRAGSNDFPLPKSVCILTGIECTQPFLVADLHVPGSHEYWREYGAIREYWTFRPFAVVDGSILHVSLPEGSEEGCVTIEFVKSQLRPRTWERHPLVEGELAPYIGRQAKVHQMICMDTDGILQTFSFRKKKVVGRWEGFARLDYDDRVVFTDRKARWLYLQVGKE